MMPVNVPMPLMMPVNVLAKTGLKSSGFNTVPTDINPPAPIATINIVTTNNSLQPAYEAPNRKNAGIIDATNRINKNESRVS